MAIDMISYLMGRQAGGGSTPSGEIEITENGEYDVTDKATAVVNVASSGGSGGYFTPKILIPIGLINMGEYITPIISNVEES